MRVRAVALSLALGPAAAQAQEMIWQKVARYGLEQFGGPIVAIGDRNGDGFDEFVEYGRGLPLNNYAFVRSGKDGALLARVGLLPRQTFWSVYPAGDMDGDGIRDYAVMFYYQDFSGHTINVIQFRRGTDDQPLWQVEGRNSYYFGWPWLGDIDLDGDSKPDVLVGEPRHPTRPGIYAFANSGKLLYRLDRPWSVFLGKLGDVDRDGCDDFLVNQSSFDTRGVVDVLSGKTGKILLTVYGERPGDYIGCPWQQGVGDVDGDGVPDFVVSNGAFAGSTQTVQMVFSGSTGKVLHTFRGLGAGPLLASGDLDLDGVADLLIGTEAQIPGTNTGGSIFWFSLRDFTLTHRFVPSGQPSRTTGLGSEVAVGQPGKDNPFPVLLTGEYRFGNNTSAFGNLGRMTLYRTSPEGVGGHGASCTGRLAREPKIGLRRLGNRGVRLHLSRAPARTPALLLLGLSRTRWGGTALPLSLGFLGLPGCELHTSIDLVVSATTGNAGIGRGYASVDIPLPLAGKVSVYGQWLVWDSAANSPGALTSALSWKH